MVQGEGPAVVLIHGFGASAFHWRFATLCPSPSIYMFMVSGICIGMVACIVL